MAKLITPVDAVNDLFALSGLQVMREGSLNDGNELDDEGHSSIHIEPFKFNEPDTSKEVEELTSLESRIDDLIYLSDSIRASAGMNQSFAMEAEKLLPGFGGVPIGYYTKDLTITRYKTSLEEMSNGLWALIGAAVVAVITIIFKIYSYFSGKDGESTEKDAEDAINGKIKGADEAPDILKDANNIIIEADGLLQHSNIILKDVNGVDFHCSSMQIAVDKLFTDNSRYGRAKKFLNSNDPIFHDIINNGKYSTVIVAVGEKIHAINSTFETKLNAIDDVIRKDLGSFQIAEELRNGFALKTLGKSIDLTIQGRTMTLDELNSYLTDIRQDVLSKEVEKKIVIDNLFSTMVVAYNSKNIVRILTSAKQSLKLFAELEKRMDKIKAITRNLSTDGSPGASTSNIGAMLREVIFATSKDVNGYRKVFAQIKEYSDYMEYLANQTLGFSIEIVRKIATEMHANKQDVPEAWDKVVSDLSMRKEAIEKAYYGN